MIVVLSTFHMNIFHTTCKFPLEHVKTLSDETVLPLPINCSTSFKTMSSRNEIDIGLI